MPVIDICAAMEHTYAEPEDTLIVMRCLDAAEDSAKDFLGRNFYADDTALAAARATVTTLRFDARSTYRLAMDSAELIADYELRKEAEDDANRTLNSAILVASRIQDGIVIKPAIVAACLLITGHLYAHREDVVAGVSVSALPNGAESLLWPSRVGLGI
jgi:hypothetical protein